MSRFVSDAHSHPRLPPAAGSSPAAEQLHAGLTPDVQERCRRPEPSRLSGGWRQRRRRPLRRPLSRSRPVSGRRRTRLSLDAALRHHDDDLESASAGEVTLRVDEEAVVPEPAGEER